MARQFRGTQKRVPCPIVSTGTVGAGATVNITVQPQENFRPDQPVVDPSIAAYFDITSVSIGNRPQQVFSGPIPGTMYPPNSQIRLGMDIADTGTNIVVTVTNTDAAAHTFKMILVGEVVEAVG